MSEGQSYSTTGIFVSWAAVPLYSSVVGMILYASYLMYTDLRSYNTQPGSAENFDNSKKDEDVLLEEARISCDSSTQSTATPEAARYQNLVHTYRTKANRKWIETHAVRGISLGINTGECFGLLGPNGAGKTTTLSILTGEVRPPTGGRVTVFGNDMASTEGMKAAYDVLGLCPQVDPLWEFVTGREHLHFYGRIKGVPESTLHEKADALLFRLGFDQADMDKGSGTYSGGMKRKLSLGISLIGQSPLLFLDEPSAAVDAGAKRHLWKVIKRRRANQTVVLTTHSMEEAEALCDRIAIQVQGQLRCLGSPTHIKHKYGSGYQLEIFSETGSGSRSGANDPDVMSKFLRRQLSPEIKLLEFHAGRYLYQLPQIGGKLSLGSLAQFRD
jgi:ABC-type multidrug transport system ATPase subunit